MADKWQRLLEQARAGDREALGELLMAHRRSCYSLALRLTGSDADADDVCQDAFSRAARDLAAWQPVGSFGSWLLSIVVCAHRNRRNSEEARRQRERSRNMMTPGSVASAVSSGLERKELRQQLDISLGQLEEDYRLPIVLHHEQGLSCAEAARVLGMPEGTVKTNIKRGLEELRGLMTAAGYTCTVPAVVGTLAQAPAVAVPAGLTAFIQSLTVAAEGGAAAVGKAAAGAAARISARISSRLAAKKAAGLALGWKVGTVLTAAAIGGAAVVAVNSGMFDEKPQPPAVTAQPPTLGPAAPPTAPAPIVLADADCPVPRTHLDGKVIFEDDFDGPTGNWELVTGRPETGYAPMPAPTEPEKLFWKGRERWGGRPELDESFEPGAKTSDVALLVFPYSTDEGQPYLLLPYRGIRSVRPIGANRFVVEVRIASRRGELWCPPLDAPATAAHMQTLAASKHGITYYPPGKRLFLWRWEFEQLGDEAGKPVFRGREFCLGVFLKSFKVSPVTTRLIFSGSRSGMCVDWVKVKEFGGDPPEEGAP